MTEKDIDLHSLILPKALVGICIILLILIIALNIVGAINYTQANIIQVNRPTSCNYSQISKYSGSGTIKCVNINKEYSVTVSQIPTEHASSICSNLCKRNTNHQGNCNGAGNPPGYNDCMSFFEIQKGCNNTRPVFDSDAGPYYAVEAKAYNSKDNCTNLKDIK